MIPFYAHLLCRLCPNLIGSDGVFVAEGVAFCRGCAQRVKQVIEAGS